MKSTSRVWLLALVLAWTTSASSATIVVDEFYSPTVNDFFLTGWQPEIDALNSGEFGTWQALDTFIAFDGPVNAGFPGEATPVCRFWTGHSHFFSASPDECAAVYENYPGFTLESWAAFYIYLPDVAGECFANEIPVYRLWDGVSDSHFYTTSLEERDYLVTNGWISEGYGPDGVAMCAPGQ